MSTKHAPTLADAMIQEYGRKYYRAADPTGWVVKNIAQARKFIMDDAMSAFMADLAYATMPMKEKRSEVATRRAHTVLENIRHTARLPHRVTWIEFNMRARIQRARENYGANIHSDLGPDKGGWLLVQHPQIDTAFICVECTSHSIQQKAANFGPGEYGYKFADSGLPLEARPNASPMAYCWTVDETIPPWRLVGAEEGKHHWASALLSGVISYTIPQVGWTLAPWADNPLMRRIFSKDAFEHLQRQLASDLRYLWALLTAINDTPVSYRAVTPIKGHMVGRDYKRFSAHTVVTLQVPHKMDMMRLAKKIARAARRRAHQVRGHFRKDYRHPGEKIWIAEHQRGDASLGFVLHDYKVEHPTQ